MNQLSKRAVRFFIYMAVLLGSLAWLYAVPGDPVFDQPEDPPVQNQVEKEPVASDNKSTPAFDKADSPTHEIFTVPSSHTVHGGNPMVYPHRRRRGELAIVFFDIGQGEAVFFQTPGGKNILLDTGDGNYNRFGTRVDAANGVILPFFEKNEITELDYLISSHPHSDHIGAMTDIIREMDVKQNIQSGRVHTTRVYEFYLEALERAGTPVDGPREVGGSLRIGDHLDLGGVGLTFLRFSPHASNINNASISFMLTHGDKRFLFTGDTHRQGERQIVENWPGQLKADLLHVGHHGSRSSTVSEFVKEVQPDYAVIQAGKTNSYGHPTEEVLSRLKEHNAEILRTDQLGTIVIFSNGNRLRVSNTADLTVYQ